MRRSAKLLGDVACPRGPYNRVGPQDLVAFQSILSRSPKSRIKIASGEVSLEKYNADWMRQTQGNAPVVLLPTTSAEVASILKHCNDNNLAVCPQGGNTGLVFGSNPVHDEIVLSLEGLNAQCDIHRNTLSATVDAGVILESLQNAARASDLLVPLDMGSKGSCTIGGNVSTSAGGIHFARYGSMRSNVLGLEVVTPQGEILTLMSSLRKDNVGYDLKQLYIGSEGTLGIVTKVELRLFPYPKSSNLALLLVKDFASLLKVFQLANETLAESLSAFEVMDATSIGHGGFPFPASLGTEYGIFVETHGSNEGHNMEKLASFVEACEASSLPSAEESTSIGGPLLLQQIIATTPTQTKALWRIREELPVKLAQSGKIYKFDLSFALDQFDSSVKEAKRLLYDGQGLSASEVIVVGYGHFGDGNVHLNVIDVTRRHDAAIHAALYPAIYEFTARRNGSVSAEHGVGRMKKEYVPLSRPAEALRIMRGMKAMLDPKGILNPYKVI